MERGGTAIVSFLDSAFEGYSSDHVPNPALTEELARALAEDRSVVWIMGPPGSGKTSFLSWFTQQWHCPHYFFQRATGWDELDFYTVLTSQLRKVSGQDAPTSGDANRLERALSNAETPDPRSLQRDLQRLLALAGEQALNGNHKLVLTLDGLDECGQDIASRPLDMLGHMPKGVSLVFSSRPSPTVQGRETHRILMSSLTAAQVGSLAERFRQQLSEETVKRLLATTSGHPVYVLSVLRWAAAKGVSVLDSLAGQSPATFQSYIRKCIHELGDSYRNEPAISALVTALAVAEVPVSKHFLVEALHSLFPGLSTLKSPIDKLEPFLTETEDGRSISFFHPAVAEGLTSHVGDATQGHIINALSVLKDDGAGPTQIAGCLKHLMLADHADQIPLLAPIPFIHGLYPEKPTLEGLFARSRALPITDLFIGAVNQEKDVPLSTALKHLFGGHLMSWEDITRRAWSTIIEMATSLMEKSPEDHLSETRDDILARWLASAGPHEVARFIANLCDVNPERSTGLSITLGELRDDQCARVGLAKLVLRKEGPQAYVKLLESLGMRRAHESLILSNINRSQALELKGLSSSPFLRFLLDFWAYDSGDCPAGSSSYLSFAKAALKDAVSPADVDSLGQLAEDSWSDDLSRVAALSSALDENGASALQDITAWLRDVVQPAALTDYFEFGPFELDLLTEAAHAAATLPDWAETLHTWVGLASEYTPDPEVVAALTVGVFLISPVNALDWWTQNEFGADASINTARFALAGQLSGMDLEAALAVLGEKHDPLVESTVGIATVNSEDEFDLDEWDYSHIRRALLKIYEKLVPQDPERVISMLERFPYGRDLAGSVCRLMLNWWSKEYQEWSLLNWEWLLAGSARNWLPLWSRMHPQLNDTVKLLDTLCGLARDLELPPRSWADLREQRRLTSQRLIETNKSGSGTSALRLEGHLRQVLGSRAMTELSAVPSALASISQAESRYSESLNSQVQDLHDWSSLFQDYAKALEVYFTFLVGQRASGKVVEGQNGRPIRAGGHGWDKVQLGSLAQFMKTYPELFWEGGEGTWSRLVEQRFSEFTNLRNHYSHKGKMRSFGDLAKARSVALQALMAVVNNLKYAPRDRR